MKGSKRIHAAVRRALAGTLNFEVDVAVERMPEGRFGVQMLHEGRLSPPIRIESWEMDAMHDVPLIPAHKRGIFFRYYAVLNERP